ncbi:hypothetical protein HN446_02055 [bacterium]|nr:hypothetical protein [bacterium]
MFKNFLKYSFIMFSFCSFVGLLPADCGSLGSDEMSDREEKTKVEKVKVVAGKRRRSRRAKALMEAPKGSFFLFELSAFVDHKGENIRRGNCGATIYDHGDDADDEASDSELEEWAKRVKNTKAQKKLKERLRRLTRARSSL